MVYIPERDWICSRIPIVPKAKWICFRERTYSNDIHSVLSSHVETIVLLQRNLVEILRFRHFSRHVVFDAEGDKFRNKRIEDYITVSVVIDMECGNTKN